VRLAPPERGSVIRYAYLWADEHRRGREEGRKDRPALVLALSILRQDGALEVLVLPVTHTPPASPSDAVAIPSEVKRGLRLDEQRAWIVTTEANAFVWPGPDIRAIPGSKPSRVIYGKIPDGLLKKIARSFLANRARQRASLVRRSV
jgi:hypothetical protein